MDYNALYKHERPTEHGTKGSIEGLIKAMGRPDMDMERFERSGAGAAVARMMENVVVNIDEHSAASVAFWAKRGMVKEFHGEDETMDWADYEKRSGFHYDTELAYPQNMVKKWTSFVPVSAFKPKNKDRKYPLMVVLHGAGNTVYTIDGWGHVDAAAAREWIVVVPSLELDEVVLDIIEQAKALYPVDERRVYLTGFSYGGFNTNVLSLQHPEVFAASAPCGMFLSNGIFTLSKRPNQGKPNEKEEPFFEFNGQPKYDVTMPIMCVIGNKDGMTYPLCDAPDVDNKLTGLNTWLKINGCGEVTKEQLNVENRSVAEKLIGVQLAQGCSAMTTADGIDYAIGDFKGADGVTRVRLICEDNVPHWPTPELSRQVTEFFSHFERDPKTHESIYHE